MSSQNFDVAYVANLARIDLTKEEETLFGEQLGKVLAYAKELQAVDVSAIPDMPADLPGNVLRGDAVRESLSAATALRNAAKHTDSLFIVPKVVE